METLITVIHISLCIILMIVILLQAGKGAEVGAVFGGSSQTIFGSRGAATFLSKVTAMCAIGFMFTSVALVYLGANKASQSIMDGEITPAVTAPAEEPEAASSDGYGEKSSSETSETNTKASENEAANNDATEPPPEPVANPPKTKNIE